MIDARARAVLDVWFEGVTPDRFDPMGPTAARWFRRDDAFDALLRERFTTDLERASRGELGSWCASPRGTLAFIVLCDQLSRNVFRGSPRAFANDALALHASLCGLARGDHRELSIPERTFFCMPLMHSESLEVHDVARREFEAIVAHAERTAPHLVGYAKNTLDYEERHRAIVERFGRYPHRNAVLGRASTPEEIDFLKQPGSSF